MRKTNPEFIIRIIVRARNEIAGVLEKASGDVDKLTKAQERGTKVEKQRADASKATAKAIDDVSKRYGEYTAKLERGERSSAQAVQQLKSFQREFDRLGNRVKAGTDAADTLYELGRSAEDMARRISKANADQVASEAKRAKAAQAASRDSMRARKAEADALISEVRRELAAEQEKAKQFDRNIDQGEKAYRRRILAIQEGREEVERAAKAEADAAAQSGIKQAEADRKRISRQQELRAEIAKTVRAQQNARSEAEKDLAAARLHAQANELRGLGMPERDIRRTMSRSYVDPSEDAAITRRQKRINELAESQRRLVHMPTPQQGFLSRLFGVDEHRIDAINKRLHEFEQSSNRSGFSAVRLAGNLRGMVIVGALVFFQQLIGVGVALGGTLVAVASAAIQAGAALGGALVAGAAQAIPVVGLLAAAWGRVGAVFDAVKQAQKARQSAAFDDAAAADRQRSAADGVRSAQEALANAQRNAVQVQEGLTRARADAVRQIQDLIAAERQAQLQAEGAALAQDDAQTALRRSLASGDVSSLAGQSLQARQAASDVLDAGVRRGRAVFDATRARKGGVEGTDGVIQARRAVADAARGIASAQRGLTEANRQASQAIQQIGTGDRLLAQLLGQLSPSEKRLFQALERIRKRYKQVFTGKGGVLESITDAFTFGVDRANSLLQDRGLIGAARDLADGIGTQLRRIFRDLSGPGARRFFTDMAKQARDNLPVVVDMLTNLGKLFANIARAGGPAFRAFLDFLSDLTGKADRATGSSSGLAKLQKFFSKGEQYAESFINLGLAISGLFLAIIGQSAQEGQNAVDSLTKSVQSATRWINSHQKETREFFRQALEATKSVMAAIWALSKGLFSLFHQDQVSAFADAFRESLLPALIAVAKVVGIVTRLFLELAGAPIGRELIQWGISTFLLFKFFKGLLGMLGKIIVVAGTLAGRIGLVTKGLSLIAFARGPWGIAIAGIIAAIILLDDKLHFLGATFQFISDTMDKVFGDSVIGQIGKMIATIAGLTAAIRLLKAGFAGLATAGALGGLLGKGAAAGGAGAAAKKLPKGGIAGLLAILGIEAVGNFGLPETKGFKLPKSQNAAQKVASVISEGVTNPFHIFGPGSEGIGSNARKFGDTAEQRLKELTKSGNVQGLIALAKQARDVAKDAGKAKDRFLEFADAARSAAREASAAMRDTAEKNRMQTIAENLISGKMSWKEFFNREGFSEEAEGLVRDIIDQKSKTRSAAENIGGAYVAGLDKGKGPTRASISSFIETLSSMQPRAQKVAADTAVGIAKVLEDRKELPAGSAQKIRDAAMAKFTDLRVSSVNTARHNVSDIATAFRNGAKPVGQAALAMARSVDKVLKSLGVAKETATGITFDNGLKADTGDITANAKAVGGWIGQQGERGKDKINAWLGRGEVVLNWAQQKAANAAMAGKDSLTGIVKRVRAYHAGGPGSDVPGYAIGGYVGNALPPANAPARNLANSLIKRGFTVTSGGEYRGTGTYHDQQDALDFGNSVNNLRKLWAILKPRAKQFAELFGPSAFAGLFHYGKQFQDAGLQADHEDHIHVAILDKLKGALGGAIKKLKRVKLGPDWKGAKRKIAQAVLDRVRKAANKKIEEASGATPELGGDVSFTGSAKGSGMDLMKEISKKYGWNFADWWEIDRRETGHGTNLSNPTSARLRGQFLDMNWGRYGPGSDPRKHPSMTEQIRSMAQYIRDRYGNPTRAREFHDANNYYARGGFVGALSRFARRFNGGGAVPGAGDQDTVNAKLTPGEHVWTAAEVMRAGGHKVMYALRGLFGGGGQSKGGGYAAGGRVLEIGDSLGVGIQQYLSKAIKGLVSDNKVGRSSEQAIDILKKRMKDAYKQVILDIGTNDGTAQALAKSLRRARKIIGEDREIILSKVHGPAAAAKNRVIAKFAAANENVTVVDPSGKRGPDGIHYTPAGYKSRSQAFINALGSKGAGAAGDGSGAYKQPDVHATNVAGFVREIDKAQKIIEGLKSDVITSKFTDALSKTVNALIGDGGLLDQMGAAVDRLATRLSVNLKRATFKLDKTGNVIKALDDVGVADATITNLREVYKALNEQQREIAESLDNIAKRLKNKNLSKGERAYLVGVQRNLTQRQRDVQSAIADNVESQYQAVEDQISARADRVNNATDKITTLLDARDRIVNLLGIGGGNREAGQQRAGVLNAQAAELQKVADRARQAGHGDAADTIAKQVTDLRLQALEIVKDGLTKDVEYINKQAGRFFGRLDLVDRLSTLRQAAGDYVGAFAQRGATLQARGAGLQNQRDQLNNALVEAALGGYTDVVNDLSDQIAELDVSIAENTAAINSNTVQARQAAIDRITGRGSFLGGVFSGLQTVVNSLGEISGAIDTDKLRALLDQQGTILQQTGEGLRGQLASGYGLNLAGMSPAQIVATLSGTNFDAIESGFSEEQRQQFEALISAIIENTSSQVSNSQAIKELTKPTAQSWSTTAWQWFRNAVFNGAGGLLTQYQNPGLGITSGTGAYSPMPQTTEMAATASTRSGTGDNVFAPVITNEERTVDMDADTLANKLYFRYRNRPSS